MEQNVELTHSSATFDGNGVLSGGTPFRNPTTLVAATDKLDSCYPVQRPVFNAIRMSYRACHVALERSRFGTQGSRRFRELKLNLARRCRLRFLPF